MTLPKKFLLFCVTFISSCIIYAADNHPNISAIQTQIKNVQRDLKTQQTSRTQLQKNLQQAEVQLAEITQREQKIAAEQKKQSAVLEDLQKQKKLLEKKLATQQDALALEIRSAYMLGQKEYLYLLLNQEDPNSISRNLTYYQYITRYQLEVIEELNALVKQVAENSQAIVERTNELTKLQNQQKQQLVEMQSKQVARESSLKQLNTVIQSKDDQLRQLLADRAALERVVRKVETAKANVGGEIVWPAGGSFAKAQGKLSWPTRGRIIASFDSPIIGQSETKLAGVLLGAPEGQDIHAIAPGRVVFAEWMSGYGLLMIINHGQGYMTLYGRNGSLFKKVGDAVSPGERIATVGKTGGYAEPGLYFAIRKQGQPLNPQGWCR